MALSRLFKAQKAELRAEKTEPLSFGLQVPVKEKKNCKRILLKCLRSEQGNKMRKFKIFVL